MHFIILKENIDKILNILSRNISTKAQLPILSNILVKTENGKINLISTNLEFGLSFTTVAKIEKEGEITVPGKLLADFINTLTIDKIEFILEGTTLLVKTKKTQASFTTISASEFPPFPETPQKFSILSFSKIKNSVPRIVLAASIDEARPVLTGVKTVIKTGKITFSATDGYRLSFEQVDIPDKKEELQTILPAQSLSEVVRIASEFNTDEVGFALIENKNQAVFSLPNILIYTRLIDGEFPNIEKIIPASFKTKIIIEKNLFLQAVKTTSLFARGAANIIKIKIEKNGLKLSAATPQVGSDEDFVEAEVIGEDMEIAFNFRFLLDLLANFPSEKLSFELLGPLNPGVFKPIASPSSPLASFLHIIMPVRIQG